MVESGNSKTRHCTQFCFIRVFSVYTIIFAHMRYIQTAPDFMCHEFSLYCRKKSRKAHKKFNWNICTGNPIINYRIWKHKFAHDLLFDVCFLYIILLSPTWNTFKRHRIWCTIEFYCIKNWETYTNCWIGMHTMEIQLPIIESGNSKTRICTRFCFLFICSLYRLLSSGTWIH